MVTIRPRTILIIATLAVYALSLTPTVEGHGTSYVSVHNKHGGKYEYKIVHSKHQGHASGHAYPRGFGGFGEKHHDFY